MTVNKRDKAMKAIELAIRDIAAVNDYPPAPMYYLDIQRTWNRMVTKARKAVKKLDDLTERDL